MLRLPFLVSLTVVSSVLSLKILVDSPVYAPRHTNFLARIADTLTEAGHDVTFFTPIIDESRRSTLGVKLTKDIVTVEPDDAVRNELARRKNLMAGFWTMNVDSTNGHKTLDGFRELKALSCANTLRNKKVLEELRARHYDVAITEPLSTCGLAMFKFIGIERVVMATSCTNYDIMIPALGDPEETSYLPSMNSQISDKMSFSERLENHRMMKVMTGVFVEMFDGEMAVYRKHLGQNHTDWRDLIADASLHMTNSIPYIDFPRPTLQKTIPIGGIAVDLERIRSEKVSKDWDEILGRREKSMFLSFGTLAKSAEMPTEFKKNLLEVFRGEPNVTFIWKYESDDVEFANDVENVVFSKWVPQTALLNDRRLTAFLSHGGLGSTNEAAHLGKPAVMVPIFADQYRNSQMLVRQGMAVVLHKRELGDLQKVKNAFHSILYDESYRVNAARIAEMLRNQPLKPKEMVVKYVEFVGKHGPFHQMTPYSLKMPFYQRYQYDVYAFIGFTYLLPVTIGLVVLKYSLCYFK